MKALVVISLLFFSAVAFTEEVGFDVKAEIEKASRQSRAASASAIFSVLCGAGSAVAVLIPVNTPTKGLPTNAIVSASFAGLSAILGIVSWMSQIAFDETIVRIERNRAGFPISEEILPSN